MIIALFTGFNIYGQQLSTSDYIAKYKDVAIREMNLYKIPASITLAQGILESGNGNSELSVNTNNHFGIKCKAEWTGEKYLHDDDEKNECFRKYKTAEESYRDHSLFLTGRERYAGLFKLEITDYKGWAYGLKQAGYATCPTYADKLIKIIEDNKLYEFDISKDTVNEIKDNNNTQSEKIIKIDTGKIIVNDNNAPVIENPDFGDVNIGVNRILIRNNGVSCIIAEQGDTYRRIAAEFELMVTDLSNYNDSKPDRQLLKGEFIYLEPKKRSCEKNYHIVISEETMWKISQLYGVKLNYLYKKNKMKKGEQPVAGCKVKLR